VPDQASHQAIAIMMCPQYRSICMVRELVMNEAEERTVTHLRVSLEGLGSSSPQIFLQGCALGIWHVVEVSVLIPKKRSNKSSNS